MTRLLREHRTLVAVLEAARTAGLPEPTGAICSILERFDDHTVVSLQVATVAEVNVWAHFFGDFDLDRDASVRCRDWMDAEVRVWCATPAPLVLSGRLL